MSAPCRGFRTTAAVLAAFRGPRENARSPYRYAGTYESEYWANERAKEFVHQPKPKTEALVQSLFDRTTTGKRLMRKAELRWFEDDDGVRHLEERLAFFRDYLELDREGVRRVIQGDYKLVQKDFLDVEKDLKPFARFLRKELEFTNKEVGEMLVKCPSLFRGYIHEMKRVVKYLYHLGIPFYWIKKVCYKVPHVLHADIDVKTPKVLMIVKNNLPASHYLQIVKHPFNRRKERKHQLD